METTPLEAAAPASPPPAANAGGTQAGGAQAGADEDSADDVNPTSQIPRRVFDESNSRDPFQYPVDDTPIAPIGVTDSAEILRECDLEEHPLGQTDYQDLTVTGLLTGTAVPRAMIRLSSNPQALFVEEGAQVGPNCALRVSDIRDNEIELARWSATDEAQVPIVIPLTTDLLIPDDVIAEQDARAGAERER